MIKNIMTLLLVENFTLSTEQINRALGAIQFAPCTPMQALSVGWSPRGDFEDFAKKIGNHIVMTYVTEKKVVPGPVFKQAVKDEVKVYENREGQAPSKSELKEIKEIVMSKLLPRAFPKRAETLVWIDLERKTINMNTGTSSRMEEALSSLVRHINNFPKIEHIQTDVSPSAAMSEWLLVEPPAQLTVDDKCELVFPNENKPTIKYVRHSLEGEDVREHIRLGKVPVSVSMTYNDRLSFTLNDKMLIKGITPLDVIGSELEEAGAEGADELFSAEFLLIADELGNLTQHLIEAMGGNKTVN